MKAPFVIIGGGLAGLSIGWHLRKLQIPTLLIEKETVGSGASQAAAGLLTPSSEFYFGEEKLLSLFQESLALYPSFIEALKNKTGSPLSLNQNGSLFIAIDGDDEAELERVHQYQQNLGLPWKSISKLEETEPLLNGAHQRALHMPHECCVDTLELIHTLKQAYVEMGGHLLEHTSPTSFKVENNRLVGMEIKGEFLTVEGAVLACGLTSSFPGLPSSLLPPLRGVKGQVLEVKNNTPLSLTRTVRTLHRFPAYLVPRDDGRIIIGATSEEVGLNPDQTAGALMDLIYGAWKIMPAVYDMPVLRTWVGYRPALRDHWPLLGPSPIQGLYGAMGLYRHGVLLTPVVGKLLAELMANKTHSDYFDVFGWKRFS